MAFFAHPSAVRLSYFLTVDYKAPAGRPKPPLAASIGP